MAAGTVMWGIVLHYDVIVCLQRGTESLKTIEISTQPSFSSKVCLQIVSIRYILCVNVSPSILMVFCSHFSPLRFVNAILSGFSLCCCHSVPL